MRQKQVTFQLVFAVVISDCIYKIGMRDTSFAGTSMPCGTPFGGSNPSAITTGLARCAHVNRH